MKYGCDQCHVMQNEIDRLRNEVRLLKEQLKEHEKEKRNDDR
jgi:hypothetical protein